MTLARIALGTLGVAGALVLLIVVVGTFLPRIPVIGFFGSFLSGQYPVHVVPAALLGVGMGLGLVALDVPRLGVVVAVVGGVALVGSLVVLGTLRSSARAEGARIDWWSRGPARDPELVQPPGPPG